MAGKGRGETVEVGGHRLQLTNLDKVLYPDAGTTKAEIGRASCRERVSKQV